MAENYGHLVQCVGKTRLDTVFSSRDNTITIIKDIIICNNDIEGRKYSLAIVKTNPSDGILEAVSNKAYIFRDAEIGPNETVTISAMWCLDPESAIRFGADKDGVVALNMFGITVGK